MSEPRTAKVLLVDDERQFRFVVRAHLRVAGYKVIEASSGVEAVEAASRELPDVILMDLSLPQMDGLAATRAIRDDPATEKIPVIMITARSRSSDVVDGLEAGAQEYLVKPFDMTELLARVRTVLRLSSARKELDSLNARLEAEVAAKTRRLQLLYEYMRELNAAKDRDRICDLVMKYVCATTGARRISLFLVDNGNTRLECHRAIGVDASKLESIPLDKVHGITGQVYRSGKTLSAMTIGQPGYTGDGYQGSSFVSTPLITTSLETHDGTIGVLNVTDKDDDRAFSEEEVECIRSIADAAAIALENVQRRQRLQQSVRVLLRTVGRLAEYRDEETTLHLERVARMSRVLAEQLRKSGPYTDRIKPAFVERLVQAAPMHDIGKVGIPDDILTKPGKLTDEEYQIMKTHTDIGRRVLSEALDASDANPLLHMCVDIAYCHHEHFDGKGYPRRLSGEQIPLAARIIALVDAYDAMTSQRRYKAAMTHEDAVRIIGSESGRHFDPHVVNAFLQCERQFQRVREEFSDRAESRAPALA